MVNKTATHNSCAVTQTPPKSSEIAFGLAKQDSQYERQLKAQAETIAALRLQLDQQKNARTRRC
jgi:hypothetical protein